MRRRVNLPESQPDLSSTPRNVRKRKRTFAKTYDYDSSSNDETPRRVIGHGTPSIKQGDNASIRMDTSTDKPSVESPKPVYTLRPSIVNNAILTDLRNKSWRLGKPIGKGNFGEIFLASDNVNLPVTNENAKYVVKMEPHSNGPLYVEIHCLFNVSKQAEGSTSGKASFGVPDFISCGSTRFNNIRYRFLVLERFERDLHSIIKNSRVDQKSVLMLAVHIINALEDLHDKGYCHNDVKAQNIMISKRKYKLKQPANAPSPAVNGARERSSKITAGIKYYDDDKQPTTDSGNSTELGEVSDEDDRKFAFRHKVKKYEDEDFEDFDDGGTSQSNNSNSLHIYETPMNKKRKRRPGSAIVEWGGSNPVRSCRRQRRNSIYEEMVMSHYLRPVKRISYSEFFAEDGLSKNDPTELDKQDSTDDESEDFVPYNERRSPKKRIAKSISSANRRSNRRLKEVNCVAEQSSRMQTATVERECVFLIDFGLACKFMSGGAHRPFFMDQRRAHDGTLEFTSRDAHMGAHSRRSDLECLGYNLIYWSQGYLPWKEAAADKQQERVHRAKEYLMTDVREMLRQIYGKQVPKFLGEFLHHVGQLAYDERPDYALYRQIFEREYRLLCGDSREMILDCDEMARNCVRYKEEIENKNIFDMSLYIGGIKQVGVTGGTPFQELNLSNRVSPKNLRSMTNKKVGKKKKFSWTEVLSQDPDQIARERAEKEYDRVEELSELQQPQPRRYMGNPTYAIKLLKKRIAERQIQGKECPDGNSTDRSVAVTCEENCKTYLISDEEEQQTESDDENEVDTESSYENCQKAACRSTRRNKKSKTANTGDENKQKRRNAAAASKNEDSEQYKLLRCQYKSLIKQNKSKGLQANNSNSKLVKKRTAERQMQGKECPDGNSTDRIDAVTCEENCKTYLISDEEEQQTESDDDNDIDSESSYDNCQKTACRTTRRNKNSKTVNTGDKIKQKCRNAAAASKKEDSEQYKLLRCQYESLNKQTKSKVLQANDGNKLGSATKRSVRKRKDLVLNKTIKYEDSQKVYRPSTRARRCLLKTEAQDTSYQNPRSQSPNPERLSNISASLI